tara:strand:+ start:119 stop:244 length:126 start_codon:yes stop_codon:yes gene_type:complete
MKHINKEFIILCCWYILLFIFLSFYACGGGWEVCGYELDKI